ncbi:MAG: acetyl-CoA carboxylase, carboxyltransferase subunit beta [Kiritimatiellia bacterium]|jgi:acetyl-CoA carboxylase carboxyl transferase subunit beta
MGWFTSSSARTKELPADIWQVCPSCQAHIFKDEWAANMKVCPKCNFHDRLGCRERIDLLVDSGSFREFNQHIVPSDPLGFSDAKEPYKEKAEATVKKLGISESVITGSADIEGVRVVLAVMDFRFLGGSLASGSGEKIVLAIEHALRFKRAFLMVSASGGARMHEGIISLMQMAKTCAAVAKLQKARLPFISILSDPTTGGVSASYAMIGDINIAEPGTLIGFAGRRVIEQTIKQKLPKDFQTAEYLRDHGFVDAIVNRKDLKGFLAAALAYRQK